MSAWIKIVGDPRPPSRRAVDITSCLAVVCALVGGLSCPSERARERARDAGRTANDIVLFFTGSELGALKPCGCSGGQLGGLEKRPGIFATVPRRNRLVVDTGSLVRSDQEQDLIKYRVLFEAFGLLDYDLVHLTAQDMAIARNLNLLGDATRPFSIISAEEAGDHVPRAFTRLFKADGRTVRVNIVAFDPEEAALEDSAALFPEADEGERVNILILRACDQGVARDVAARVPGGVDCVICPSDSDEPRLLSDPGARPLVFTVGRFGRYVCRLGVHFSPQRQGVGLTFTAIPVQERLPENPTLVALYKSYQQLVKDSRLLEQYPRVPLPEGLTFVNSETCKPCHAYEYDKWSAKAHADAFATLREVGSDYDPECVVCHVVGMEYETGFVTEATTPQLRNVGCENCHGPGSEHARTFGQAPTVQPKMTCLDCHTPEHSAGYAGHEEEYMEKIVHWREP